MNVSLPPHLDTYVRDLVQGGDYGSASEVVRDGLRLLRQKQEQDRAVATIQRLMADGLESPVVRMTRVDLRDMIGQQMEWVQEAGQAS